MGQDSIPALLADSVVVADSGLDTALFDHELDWLEWLRGHHCSSSDTLLLNIRDFAEDEVPKLDTAELQRRMAVLNAASPLDLGWNPIAHSRVRFYASKRRKHLGTMLGRAPAYFPIFEQA